MSTNNDQWLRAQCNRYVNGTCTTLACLVRGGYVLSNMGVGGYDPCIATCEAHEILKELEELRKLKDRFAPTPTAFQFKCLQCGTRYADPEALGTPWVCAMDDCHGPLYLAA